MSDEQDEVTNSHLSSALAVLGSSAQPDNRLETSQRMREGLLSALIGGVVDPQTVTAAKGLLSDMDKSIFTARRLQQDKESDVNKDELIKAMYMQIVMEKGRDSVMKEVPVETVDPSRRELPKNTEYEFSDGEVIIGNDTENGVLQ